ncbi:MAG: MBL fold metallo-hydrolase [Gemmatimonadales bacterium]
MTASLRVIPILYGQFMQNCYLLAEEGSSDAVIVDPGEAPALFLETAERQGLTIREIWLTHGHIDHVSGVGAIKAATGAPISMHPADLPLYRNLAQQAGWFGLELDDPPPIDHELSHGQTLTLGTTSFEVRHTPGHSPGSVCLIGAGSVIGGDVLFQGSVGRVDLPGGDWEQLLGSIRDELFPLPDETVVHPGHGPRTTIGAEKRNNPFLRGLGD